MSASAEPRRTSLHLLTPWKLYAFIGIVVFALGGIVYRLTQVQIVDGTTFELAAQANQIRRIPVAAPRGRIYDRNGVLLVRSRPSFVCGLVPSEVRDPVAMMRLLSKTLGVDERKLWRRLLHHHGIDYAAFDEVANEEPYGPVILADNLTTAQMARLAEAQAELPGVDLEAQPVRDYPYGKLGSHITGYVGAISEDEYKARKNQGYSPNDVVGKDGLEARYDDALRGVPGGEQIEVDAQGRLVRRLGPVEPVPGHSLTLAIDWRLQAIAERAMSDGLNAWGKSHGRRVAGALAAIDPRDGGVLALVSYPNFNPNDFTGGIKAATYRGYLDDTLQPLYDRAIGAATATGVYL